MMLFEQLYHKHRNNNPAEDLIKAAANGNLQKLEGMLSQGTCHVSHGDVIDTTPINAHHQVDDVCMGHTALQTASQIWCHQTFDGEKADLEQEVIIQVVVLWHHMTSQDKEGDWAIHRASFGDEPKIVELLGEAVAYLNVRNWRHQTPLHAAINKGHIRVLLKNNCHTSL